MTARSLVSIGGLILAVMHVGTSSALAAPRSDETVHEAGRHFQRGVTLYGETDYRGALVEFRRAYELAPNAAVLYNIGETEYQLRDYAGALTTFEKYLSESSAGDGHRTEVEGSVRELKSRVGRITITTVPRGADVSIDDRPLGKTFENPVIVGLGHIKVTATLPGRAPVTQYVDVAAEDDVSVLLQLPAAQSSRTAERTASDATTPAEASAPARGSLLRPLGWIATGVLGAGAVVFGVLAIRKASDLKAERDVDQDNGTNANYAKDKLARLDQLANRTRTYSILADSLGAAAVIVGAVTLISSMSSRGEIAGSGDGPGPATKVSLGYRSMNLTVTF
jgi:PEGA domain